MKFSKKIVTAIIVLNVLYTIGALIAFCYTGTEATVLTASWFAFTTGELYTIGKIKRTEVENEAVDEATPLVKLDLKEEKG